MTLPAVRDARQLLRLRALRVQRAREACAAAQASLDEAAEVVRERQRAIGRSHEALQRLTHTLMHGLAGELPRWADLAAAQRAALDDRLERDQFALVDEEHELEARQEALQRARAGLTRALAREDAVRDLAQASQRALLALRERRSEVEIEDQARRAGVPGVRA